MRLVLARIAPLLLGCSGLCAQTPAAVAAELRGIEQDLNAYSVIEHRDALPSGWNVNSRDGDYFIPAAPLHTLLGLTSTSGSPVVAIMPAKQWLDAHATQLESLASAPEPPGSAWWTLVRILARKEFAPPAPLSLWDRIRARINQWLAQLIERLFGNISKYPVTGNIVFWAALAGALGLLAYWLITLFRPGPERLTLTDSHAAAALRTSGEWLAALSAAKRRGDMRAAVQCAYWAGVARLQDTGDLPAATARTPREYLRSAKPAVLDPLRSLTSSLERFWYGCAEPTAVDLSACVQSLEELGCRWD